MAPSNTSGAIYRRVPTCKEQKMVILFPNEYINTFIYLSVSISNRSSGVENKGQSKIGDASRQIRFEQYIL